MTRFYYVEILDYADFLDGKIPNGNFLDAENALEYFEDSIGKILREIALYRDNYAATEFDINPVFDYGSNDGDRSDFVEKVDFFPYLKGFPIGGSLARIVFYFEE